MKKIYSLLAVVGVAIAANAQIVINEVYGGGGNSGATLKNDFVELINNGSTSQTLSGAFLQYTSSTGVFGSTSNPLSNKLALPTITLAPGQTYLIQLAGGSGGTVNLPTPDFTPTGTVAPDAPLALSGTTGKIALTTNNVSPTSATDSNVLDFVGWGSANMFEGTVAPATTTTTSISRNSTGADTNVNSVDFTAGAPTPKNSQGVTLGVSDVYSSTSQFVKNTLVNNEIIFGSKAEVKVYSMKGQLVKTASVSENKNLDIADLIPGIYIVAGIVNGELVSQKILKK